MHIFLIAALGIFVYSNTYYVPFQFDDSMYITENPIVRDLRYFSEPARVKDVMKSRALFKYTFKTRFIGFLTFALNYKLQGFDVTGYHIFNVAVHILNAILIYLFTMLTLRIKVSVTSVSDSSRQLSAISHRDNIEDKKIRRWEDKNFSTSQPLNFSTSIALFSALLFVSHPIQTQAVTYIAQRITSLATFFYLLSIVMYIKFRIQQSAVSNQQSAISGQEFRITPSLTLPPRGGGKGGGAVAKRYMLYAVSFTSAVLAMMTKEISFTLPFIIVLYEFSFFEKSDRCERWTADPGRFFFPLSFFLTLFIIPLSRITTDSMGNIDIATKELTDMSRWSYLFTQFRVIITYIRLLFFPINQNLDYDFLIYNSFFNPPVFLSFLFLLSLFGFGIYLFYRSRFTIHDARYTIHNTPSMNYVSRVTHHALRLVAFGILWFFVTLSIESSIIPIRDAIFEHRLYLPSIGFIVAFSAVLFYILQRSNRTTVRQFDGAARYISSFSFLPKALSLYSSVALIVLLSIAAYQRNIVWNDEISLWNDVVSKSPMKGRGYNNLGVAYGNKGFINKAIEQYRLAVKLDPNDSTTYSNLGNAYLFKDFVDMAIEQYRTAIRLEPNWVKPHLNLGRIYLSRGRIEESQREFESVLRLNPQYYEAQELLERIYSLKEQKSIGNNAKEILKSSPIEEK
ncbi:MAG: tetratricopeptide repeat protein [Nitrospirae bacterium]|nr:tetratricopeptide repeat protein [Nitrospirota bacterium]